MKLSNSELSTMRIALLSWANRCQRDAAQMDEMASDESLTGEYQRKAARNAKASREFEAEARALAERIRTERRA